MRKIAANYVMPVSSPPLKNGIVVIDDEGVILEVIDTGGRLRESSSLEFYRGIITPGFVLPWYRAGVQADSSAESAFRDLDHMLFQQGIKGIGILERKAGTTMNLRLTSRGLIIFQGPGMILTRLALSVAAQAL
jgi:hypothetical protein